MSKTDRTGPVRRVRCAWRCAVSAALAAAVFTGLQFAFLANVVAHEGHSHDKLAPLNLPIAPRVVAVTPDYELVGVLSGEKRLTIFLNRFATNEPVQDAKLSVAVGESEVEAIPKGDGVFEVTAPWIDAAEPVDILFKLVLPGDQDLLTGRLEKATAPHAAAGAARENAGQREQTLYIGVGALMAGILLTLLVGTPLARRRLARSDAQPQPHADAEPMVASDGKLKHFRRAPVAVLALGLAMGLVPSDAKTQPATDLPSVPAIMASDQPQRMPDASLFVPKATQHLLSVRTVLTAETQAARTVQLVGAAIPDPSRFGRVQPGRPGRIEAPEGGLAYVGKRVANGELLGYLLPYIEVADKANIESQIAETEARIVKLATILSRYNQRPGAMPQVKVDEVEGELEALRRKRAELRPSLVAREEIRAPIAGTISVANVVAGQIVEVREILFEVVDPSRFWMEAITHDPSIAVNLGKAFAVTNTGVTLPLQFVGVGLSLKQQAVPLTFRVLETTPNLSIGTPVNVILQSTAEVRGFVLPSASVVRGQSGLSIVWVKSDAERFEARAVRFEPLDGRRVVILAGLKPDLRVVTEGATLLNQIR